MYFRMTAGSYKMSIGLLRVENRGKIFVLSYLLFTELFVSVCLSIPDPHFAFFFFFFFFVNICPLSAASLFHLDNKRTSLEKWKIAITHWYSCYRSHTAVLGEFNHEYPTLIATVTACLTLLKCNTSALHSKIFHHERLKRIIPKLYCLEWPIYIYIF